MTRRLALLVSALVLLVASPALPGDAGGEWLLRQPDDLAWRPSDSLPPGAMVALLEGDPSKAGFFTMRVKMPDGYRVPPHSHSQQERVTVLSGTLNLGHGDTFDAKATKALGPGTYSSMPPGMAHFGWMTGEVVLQLSTMGPWTLTYVHPEDGPR
ncbi:MAG: cupin domain-containing protein [bacterium]|nr:cupin domain-containing protein [bacterium]